MDQKSRIALGVVKQAVTEGEEHVQEDRESEESEQQQACAEFIPRSAGHLRVTATHVLF